MTTPKQQQYVDAFRRALRHATSAGNEASVVSLLASAQDLDFLQQIIRDELAPISGELEFHLHGEGVEGHSANADSFSELVRRIAASTKSFVKERTNAKKQGSDLLVDVGPGSVRVTFKAPERKVLNATPLTIEKDLEILPVEDEYSEALRRISVVLANSDPDSPESEALGAAIEQLPASSRYELAKALEPVRKEGWSIDGTFSQRGLGSKDLHLERRHAEYLRNQLTTVDVETDIWRSTGTLDGYRWSNGIAYFVPSGQSQPIAATFASAVLQSKAALLAAKEDNKVEATFKVYIKHSMTASHAKRSYELTAIETI